MSEKLYRRVEKQGCQVYEEVRPEPKPKTPTRLFEHKTVTHKIQYRDIQKVMADISLVRGKCHEQA